MTMTERKDGSRYPDFQEQMRALADFTDPAADTGLGYAYNRTLGDLIVDVLIGRDVREGITGAHEDYESFEQAMLKRVAVEIRLVNYALATGGGFSTDDHPTDAVTTEHACEYLRGLARRVEAGAELASRLRDARWGHPSFGGGEERLARDRAALHAAGTNGKPEARS